MELNAFQNRLQAAMPGIEFKFNELMSKHTSFRIGGAAEAMAFPKSREELSTLFQEAVKMEIVPVILGAGTNVLAPDDGMQGLIICLKDCLNGMELLDEDHIRVMAGVTMSRAAVFAAANGLSGLEFAHGIPGTVGGGVYMNAGAYGGEICQVTASAEVMNSKGMLRVLSGEELGFSYRHSILEETGETVVSVTFALEKDSTESIKARMKELLNKRSASQPLDLPSAGSAFKRPTGGYAAALIDQAGLKGFRVGQAGISEKHAGFAVNLGGATANDVRKLLEQVSEQVFLHSGIRLEPEIRIW